MWSQLGGRARTAASFATFLAIRSASGGIAARADLYMRDGSPRSKTSTRG